MKKNSIRIGAGASYAGDRIEPAAHLAEHGDLDYLVFETLAERTIALFYPAMQKNPAGYATLCAALDECLNPPSVLVLRGDEQSMTSWKAALDGRFQPTTLIVAVPVPGAIGGARLPPLLDKPPPQSGVSAYLCSGASCLAPVNDLAGLDALLGRPT
jgi:uncharacterized protein YyaL (SSP411 family)